jgi:hypothetical protein
LQDTAKFAQIRIFGLKICHLATLLEDQILRSYLHNATLCSS